MCCVVCELCAVCVLYMSERVLCVAFVCVCVQLLFKRRGRNEKIITVCACLYNARMYIFLVSVNSMYVCVYCEWE